MIRINCGLVCETGELREKAIALATELVELSLHDRGVIDYDLVGSLTNSDRLMIYETWESAEALQAHQQSEHFRRLVPRLKEIATFTSERFDF